MRISDCSSDVCSSDLLLKGFFVTEAKLDIVAIGNAIVDVIAQADDAFLASHALAKGGMQLVDPETAELIYNEMGPGREISGGSAANTLAGMAPLGMKCGFIGPVCADQRSDERRLGTDCGSTFESWGVPYH